MAWIYERGNRWWGGWRLNDKQYRRSIGSKDDAKVWLEQMKALEKARERGALNDAYIEAVTGNAAERITVAKFFAGWLADNKPNVAENTYTRYAQIVREFMKVTDAEALGLMLDDMKPEQISEFLAGLKLASGSVKGYRQVLASIFARARDRGLIRTNPVALTKRRKVKAKDGTARRPFTIEELGKLYIKADKFWKYMILGAYFTGQSLGDVVTLRADMVDLQAGLITLHRRKTNTRVVVPMSNPLRALLVDLWPKTGRGYFWPGEAAQYLESGASPFSQEFYNLMAQVGIITDPRDYRKFKGNGRAAKRELNEVGFHCIRRSFVTNIKAGGAMDSVAMELAGHESRAVSAVYTNLPIETLSRAIASLPEFTT